MGGLKNECWATRLAISECKKEVLMEIVRKMFRAGEPAFRVIQYTKLDKDTILQFQKEVGEPDGVLV